MSSRAFLWIYFLNKHLYLITVVKNVGFYLLVCFCTPEGPGTHYIDQTHCLPVSSDGIKGVACNKCAFFISPQHAQALVYAREAVCHCAVPKACFYDFFFKCLKARSCQIAQAGLKFASSSQILQIWLQMCVTHLREYLLLYVCGVCMCVQSMRSCMYLKRP